MSKSKTRNTQEKPARPALRKHRGAPTPLTGEDATWPHDQSSEYTIADMPDGEVGAFAENIKVHMSKKNKSAKDA